jgi:hypothetical protein
MFSVSYFKLSESDVSFVFVKLIEKMTAPKSEAMLRIIKRTENALPATRDSTNAAEFNLRSAYDVLVPTRGKK